jgi:hypothetical protein
MARPPMLFPPESCGHPDGPRERQGAPAEFDGMCDSCLSGWLDTQRQRGLHIAFSGTDAGRRPARFRRFRQSARAALRCSGGTVHRVAVQGYAKARQAGRVMASRVIAIQRGARLPEHMMRNSARAIIDRPDGRRSDLAWRQGYRQIAEASVSGLADRELVPARPPEPAGTGKPPPWPQAGSPADPDKEAGS